MKIKKLEGQAIEELSMIDVAHSILEQRGEELSFADLLKEVKSYLKLSDADINAHISHFYTELNTDGSFLPLGGNIWALRSWYAIDQIDEETITLDELDEDSALIIEDDSNLLFADEETEEKTPAAKAIDDIIYDESPDDEKDEVKAYDEDLKEVDVDAPLDEEDDDDEMPEEVSDDDEEE